MGTLPQSTYLSERLQLQQQQQQRQQQEAGEKLGVSRRGMSLSRGPVPTLLLFRVAFCGFVT